MSSLQVKTVGTQQVFGGDKDIAHRPARSVGQAMWRGLLCRCPHCGEGKLFRKYLKSVDACAVCGEDYRPQRADDLPAYLTVIIVGHIVIAGAMIMEASTKLPLLVHLAVWSPLTVFMALAMLQPIKGSIIGLQWALYMHGFGGEEKDDA
jgi:uncharacterized protein (DUF983 family)